jgi:hypothetical protein
MRGTGSGHGGDKKRLQILCEKFMFRVYFGDLGTCEKIIFKGVLNISEYGLL